jgi:hypothetical protein
MPALSRVDEAGLLFADPGREAFGITVTARSRSTHKGVSAVGREIPMCDYSLHTFPNRLAADGEDLIVHRFAAGSLGLASPSDLGPVISATNSAKFWSWSAIKEWFHAQSPRWEARNRIPAVCVPPGARLIVRDIPKSLQRDLGVGETEEVEFVEITADINAYRDALRFHNFRQILLQELREGQRVRVVSTSLAELEPVEVSWTAV